MKLYNTLTRKTETFEPRTPGTVKLYTCGLTVYSQPHVGNWLPYIYWDVLVRVLRAEGYEVERTQNITDVGHLVSDDDSGEDKMETGAKREGKTAWDVADTYIRIAANEAETLGLLPADHLVRATDCIDEQIAFAKALDEKGFLYEIAGDGMYFDTAVFNRFAAQHDLAQYGELARLDIDGLAAGARVSVAGKRNPTDFAVWKFSPTDTQRDMEWDSPWGKGFPGWHLECSVIARQTLGDQLDIHAGGVDHVPVHHINEIAQTEALTGKQFSRYWLHNNHMKVDGQKMSKSLGNIYTLADVVQKGFEPAAFRVFALQKQYRTEGNFTWENLSAAQNRLDKWREASATRWQEAALPKSERDINAAEIEDKILTALADDLDTPRALQVLDTVADEALAGSVCPACLDNVVDFARDYLGLDIGVANITAAQAQVISERESARHAQDWAKSDKLRHQLLQQGIGVRDTPTGSVWYRSR